MTRRGCCICRSQNVEWTICNENGTINSAACDKCIDLLSIGYTTDIIRTMSRMEKPVTAPSTPTIADIIKECDQLRADLAAEQGLRYHVERDRDDANGEAEVFRKERDAARARVEELEGLLRAALRNRGMGFNGGICGTMCVIDREILAHIDAALTNKETK